ncbi:hypothetical protein ACX93W_11925 [Paenibacillus sp. CAU 1782]
MMEYLVELQIMKGGTHLDIIKGFLGYVFIIVFYLSVGSVLGSSLFGEESFLFYFLEYIVLALIALPNCKMSVKTGQIKKYIGWLLISTIPGASYMLFAKFSNSPGGLVTFPWDWIMWSIFLPGIFVIAQLFFLPFALAKEKKEEA